MIIYCFGGQEDKWLVVFCDEVNLPQPDAYNTARVITFMRQMVEQQGYWQSDGTWVRMERINFVGASNPPTDAGRVPLPLRLLRHMPVVLVRGPLLCLVTAFPGLTSGAVAAAGGLPPFGSCQVDFPERESLTHIYGTFNRGLLKLHPPLRSHADVSCVPRLLYATARPSPVEHTSLGLATGLDQCHGGLL